MQTRREEIDNLKTRVDKVTTIGHELIQSSSDVRATDIDSRLTRLSDAWSRLDNNAKTRYYLCVLCSENCLFGFNAEDVCGW